MGARHIPLNWDAWLRSEAGHNGNVPEIVYTTLRAVAGCCVSLEH